MRLIKTSFIICEDRSSSTYAHLDPYSSSLKLRNHSFMIMKQFVTIGKNTISC